MIKKKTPGQAGRVLDLSRWRAAYLPPAASRLADGAQGAVDDAHAVALAPVRRGALVHGARLAVIEAHDDVVAARGAHAALDLVAGHGTAQNWAIFWWIPAVAAAAIALLFLFTFKYRDEAA